MKQRIILDTGPLVAFLNSQDNYHSWALKQWAQITPPLLTCEAVLSETCFLLNRLDGGINAVIELLHRKVIEVPFRLSDNINQIAGLLKKYCDVPMSLADACLVGISEFYNDSMILTFDADFTIYRKNKRQVIPILSPK